MKTKLLMLVLVAAVAVATSAAFHKFVVKADAPAAVSDSRAEQTEIVAYLSDLDRRIAMFIIPLNYTTNGPWTSFELKASTNDFCHGLANEIPESVFMQYFMDSDIADVGGTYNGAILDHAKLYICNEPREDQGLEKRSYTRIPNTLFSTNGVSRHLEEVVVLVDACDLVRYEEELDTPIDEAWLTCLNKNLMWVYGRKGRIFDEEAHGSKPMWRPTAPVRWFKEMPNWAQLADDEYYKHFPTNEVVNTVPSDIVTVSDGE